MTLFWPSKNLLILSLFGLIACQGGGAAIQDPIVPDVQTIETVITKPAEPKEVINLPDFSALISVTGLADQIENSETALDPEWDKALAMRGLKGHIKLVSDLLSAAKVRLNSVADFSKKAAGTLSLAGFDPKQPSSISASLAQSRVFDLDGDWLVHTEKEAGLDSAFRIFYDINDETVGMWLANAVQEGVARKGIWAFVNPDLLDKTTEVGQRALIVAYDVIHSDRMLFVIREEKAMADHPSVLNEIHVQCDGQAGQCVAEVIRADGSPGALAVTGSLRMSWDQSKNICLEESKPGDQNFEAAVTLDGKACDMSEPAWGSQPLSDEDLVLGYFDTEPPGGDASLILLDGQTQDGWLSLTDSLIDGWVSGMSL